MKVKLIIGYPGDPALGRYINEWLEENPSVKIVDIKLTYCETTVYALIIYK